MQGTRKKILIAGLSYTQDEPGFCTGEVLQLLVKPLLETGHPIPADIDLVIVRMYQFHL